MKMIDLVEPQIIAEVGKEEWEEKEVSKELMFMLAQKWGLRIPALTQSELYLIHKEELQRRGLWKKSRNQS